MAISPNKTNTPLPSWHHTHTPLPSLPVSFLIKMGKSGKRGDNPIHDRKIFWVNFQEKREKNEIGYLNIL
jgi:hypothetical protein